MTDFPTVGSVDDFPDGQVVLALLDKKELAVSRVGPDIYVTAARCTHADVLLIEGFIDCYEIECPAHEGRFDVRTGLATCAHAEVPLRCYPVRIRNGHVLVDLRQPDDVVQAEGLI